LLSGREGGRQSDDSIFALDLPRGVPKPKKLHHLTLRRQSRAKPPGKKKDRVSKKPDLPSLADQGIDKNLADRARKAAAMEARKERHSGRGDQKTGSQAATPKLADLGISKMQPSRWQQLAKLPKKQAGNMNDQCAARCPDLPRVM
jgi:hypothetical protein